MPLAEWSLFGLLAFTKGLPRLRRDAAERRWDHYPVAELRGRTLLVVGVGEIGAEVARLAERVRDARARRQARHDEPVAHVEAVLSAEAIDELVAEVDAIVITLPLTERDARAHQPAARSAACATGRSS